MAYSVPTYAELLRRQDVATKAKTFVMDRSRHGGLDLVMDVDQVEDGKTSSITGDAAEALAEMFSVYVTDKARAGVDLKRRQRSAVDSAIYHARNFCVSVLNIRVSDDPSAPADRVKPGFKLAEVYFRLAIKWAEDQLSLPEPARAA